jgi:predicted DNA-binding antitoxin AbrB/MazE fold protein
MLKPIEAIYENGVLRPLEPLPLAEHAHVQVSFTPIAEEDWLDQEFMDSCGSEGNGTISLEELRRSLSTIRGSMNEAIDLERGDF